MTNTASTNPTTDTDEDGAVVGFQSRTPISARTLARTPSDLALRSYADHRPRGCNCRSCEVTAAQIAANS